MIEFVGTPLFLRIALQVVIATMHLHIACDNNIFTLCAADKAVISRVGRNFLHDL